MPSCIVRSCNTYWKRKEPGIILHAFPKDRTRIMQWLQQTRQYEDNLEGMIKRVCEGQRNGVFRICSKHFSTDCYTLNGNKLSLKKDALPTIFESSLPRSGSSCLSKADAQGRKKMRYDCGPCTCSCTSVHNVTEAESVNYEDASCSAISTSFTCDPTSSSMSCRTSVSDTATDAILKVTSTDSQHPTISDKSRSIPFHKIYVRQRVSRGTMTQACHKRFRNKAVGTDLRLLKPFMTGKIIWNKRDQATQCNLLYGTEYIDEASAPEISRTCLEGAHMSDLDEDISVQCVNQEAPLSLCVSSEQQCMSTLKDQTSLIQNEDSSPLQDIVVENQLPTLNSCKPSLHTFDEVSDKINSEDVPIDVDTFEFPPQSQIWEEKTEKDYVTEKKFIVFESCLDWLLKFVPCLHPNCKSAIVGIKKKLRGSCMCVTTVCDSQHEILVWSSQPVYNKMPVGDILLSSAVLYSGCNFSNLNSLFQLFGIQSIEKSTYCSNQKEYLFPVLHHHWLQEENQVIQSLHGKSVCVSSHKQCDNQSQNAKNCAFTFFEHSTKKVIGFHVQQRKPGTSIIELEKQAFKKALDSLVDKKLIIKMVCTDRHISIRKLLRKRYEGITHKYDIWHMAESIGKKIAALSRLKHCDILSSWVGAIRKHVLWSARFCKNDFKALKEMWSSVVYHTINIHEWEGASHYQVCRHSALTLENHKRQRWLQAGTPAHSALRNAVLNKAWLRDLQHISSVCHVEEMANFHKSILKYQTHENCLLDETVARTELAALEHNYNVDQRQMFVCESTTDGDAVRLKLHRLQERKATSDCVLQDRYKPGGHDFIFPILCDVLKAVKGSKVFGCRALGKDYPTNIVTLSRPMKRKIC